MKSLVGRLGEALGLSPPRPSTPPGRTAELFDRLLPVVAVTGLPSSLVVVDVGGPEDAGPDREWAISTGALTLPKVLANLARMCAHRDGFSCRICRDARSLTSMVRQHGRVRAIPRG